MLFIGTPFSNLYTAVDTPGEKDEKHFEKRDLCSSVPRLCFHVQVALVYSEEPRIVWRDTGVKMQPGTQVMAHPRGRMAVGCHRPRAQRGTSCSEVAGSSSTALRRSEFFAPSHFFYEPSPQGIYGAGLLFFLSNKRHQQQHYPDMTDMTDISFFSFVEKMNKCCFSTLPLRYSLTIVFGIHIELFLFCPTLRLDFVGMLVV